MKTKGMVFVVVMALVGTVTATGQVSGLPGEDLGTVAFGWGDRESETEEVSLTGMLNLQEGRLPLLQADGMEYVLMIPPALAAELDVEDGERITVEGVSVERQSQDLLGSTTYVAVRVVQIGSDRFVAVGPVPGGYGRTPMARRGSMSGHPYGQYVEPQGNANRFMPGADDRFGGRDPRRGRF